MQETIDRVQEAIGPKNRSVSEWSQDYIASCSPIPENGRGNNVNSGKQET